MSEQKQAAEQPKRWKVAPKRPGGTPECVIAADTEAAALDQYAKLFPRVDKNQVAVRPVENP